MPGGWSPARRSHPHLPDPGLLSDHHAAPASSPADRTDVRGWWARGPVRTDAVTCVVTESGHCAPVTISKELPYLCLGWPWRSGCDATGVPRPSRRAAACSSIGSAIADPTPLLRKQVDQISAGGLRSADPAYLTT